MEVNETKEWNKKEWEELIGTLTNISRNTTDIEINNSHIRCWNDLKTTIYDIKLSKSNFNTIFPLIKYSLPLLKLFTPTEDKKVCKTSETDKIFTISDDMSTLELKKADKQHCNNPYIADEKFAKIEECLSTTLSTMNIDQFSLERLKSIADNIDISNLLLIVKNKKASLCAKSESSAKSAKIINNIKIDIEDGTYILSYSLFQYPWEKVVLTIHSEDKEDGKYFIKAADSINDQEIIIYGRLLKD